MKKRLFLALFGLFLLFHHAKAQSPGTTFYGVSPTPVCWTTAGGVDSTIWQVALNPAGSTKPTQMYFFVPIVGTAKVQAVTVSGGSIVAGSCQDRQNIVDNDTIISNLQAIATAIATALASDSLHVVNELGCLSIVDTAGCDVTGLMVDIAGLPPGYKTVYLNGEYLFAAQVSSCDAFASAMNVWPGVTGEWSCCNDSLVVNSLDTSLYYEFIFISQLTGDTIIRNFLDTAGQTVTETLIDVEIVKIVNNAGDILTLRYYSADGETEYTGQGYLRLGPCLDDETQQYQDNVTVQLSQIINLVGGDCSVLGEWRFEQITSNTTYSTNTYNSIAIQAVSGTVSVSVDGGTAVTLSTNDVITVRADACDYVQSPVTVNVSGGAANISRFY